MPERRGKHRKLHGSRARRFIAVPRNNFKRRIDTALRFRIDRLGRDGTAVADIRRGSAVLTKQVSVENFSEMAHIRALSATDTVRMSETGR